MWKLSSGKDERKKRKHSKNLMHKKSVAMDSKYPLKNGILRILLYHVIL